MDMTKEEIVKDAFDRIGIEVQKSEAEKLAKVFSAMGDAGAGKVLRRISDGISEHTLSCDSSVLPRISGVLFAFTLFSRLSEELSKS